MPRPACHLQASNVLAKITVALASLFILSVSAGCASTEIETIRASRNPSARSAHRPDNRRLLGGEMASRSKGTSAGTSAA